MIIVLASNLVLTLLLVLSKFTDYQAVEGLIQNLSFLFLDEGSRKCTPKK